MDETLKNKLLAFFREKGIRVTPRRMAIIEAAFETEQHFSAEDLLKWARKKDPRISQATVYRTLPLLVESGLLSELHLDGQRTLYDPNLSEHPDHSHIVCRDCGKIIEFDNVAIDRVVEMITASKGLKMAQKSMKVEAHCEKLREEGICGESKEDVESESE